MNYYKIAPLGLNLANLTYKSEINLDIGAIVEIKIKSKIKLGVVIESTPEPDFSCEYAKKCDIFFTNNQICLAKFIANYYVCYDGIAFNLFAPRDFVPKSEPIIQEINIKTLNSAQENAKNFIANHSRTLLFGDTGSGKSEVYFSAIKDNILAKKRVLFLMPEIALTPQMEARLKASFGNLVCIWHSKISKAKKNNLLNNLDSYSIIAGARSALFLPIENLGLIIVDEEHDDAYKSSSNPRYNARDLAIYLAFKAKIKLILGSATPSLNSYYNFYKNNEIFRLKGRYFESKKTILFEKSKDQITQNLIDTIAIALENKRQIMIFVPIRANFKQLICQDCGEGIKCKSCYISLSLHLKQNALKCHYCGFAMPIIDTCPTCKSQNLKALKIGTQEVFKIISSHFSQARIAIFDRDEVTTDAKLRRILNDFNAHKIDILIGTQMISKGHDYHSVDLVAILGLDSLLNASDFRAIEKTMSLFYQISGRSGRKSDGKVLVSTLNENFFKRFLDDYEDFLRFELNNRAGFYPPFVRLGLVIASNKSDKIAKDLILECKKIVELANLNCEIVGVGRAPIERINGLWRHFMLLRSNDVKMLLNALHLLKNKRVSIDIDPLQIH